MKNGFKTGIQIAIVILIAISVNLIYTRITDVFVYPQTLIVTEIGNGFFYAETVTGIEYLIEESPEDLDVGDLISVIMDDRRTENDIADDEVIDWQYSGFGL